MNDHTSRNTIAPDDPGDDGQARCGLASANTPEVLGDRGMPALGQYPSARPRAWWLTPLVVVLVAGGGAVWTVHAFLARHDAEAKAHRDAAAVTSAQGRLFRDPPVVASVASASSGASAPIPVSEPRQLSVAVRRSASVPRPTSGRSYYDAPLLATGSTGGAGGEAERVLIQPSSVAKKRVLDDVGGIASTVATVAPGSATGTSGPGDAGPLAQALTPTGAPRVRASMLGARSLILPQGAKIDCAGDTAFDSTEAGISTCTVTKNVYSDDGRVVLIERGARVNSQYRSNLSPGQKRTFILAARIETPHGVVVEIDSPAADALGRMGLDGYVDNHWTERIGAAMLLGVAQDAIGYLSTRGGNSNGSVVYENTQQQGNDMATRVLDSTINIPPTLTQKQGVEFSIVVARDLDFGSVYMLQPEDTR